MNTDNTISAPFVFKKDAKTGMIENEPESYYHSTGWLGYSPIKVYNQDPYAYKMRYIEQHPDWQLKNTKSLRMGSLVDEIMTYGNPRSFVIAPAEHLTPSGVLSTKKATLAWEKSIAPRVAVGPQEWRDANMMADRLKANKVAMKYINGTIRQCTCRIVNPGNGLPMQCRPDFLAKDFSFVNDLKTTSDQSLDYVGSTVKKWGYHIQAGYYREIIHAVTGVRPSHWYITFVQSVFPYATKIIELDEPTLAEGLRIAEAALDGISLKEWEPVRGEPELINVRGVL